jgi:putative tricarboxylic transport membrane protein
MTKRRAGSLVFLVAGFYGLILTLQLPMGKWNEPGAGAFPLMVSILLCIFGIGIFVAGKGKVAVDWHELVKEQWTPFQIIVLTGAFILAMERLGYLLSSCLYIFALLYWVSRYKIWIAIGLAASIGIGSWYIFGKLFETPLPRGILPF